MAGPNDIDFTQYDDSELAPDGLFEQDGEGQLQEGDLDGLDGDGQFDDGEPDEQGRTPAQVAQQANMRGPRPAIPGAGRIPSNSLDEIANNFWNDRATARQQQQLTPQQEFFAQLTDRLTSNDQQQQQQPDNARIDAQWNSFLGDRNFGMKADELAAEFNATGNDPAKVTTVIHTAMQKMARALYRELATDMQASNLQLIQQSVQPMIQQQLQTVDGERSYAQARAGLMQRNPHYMKLGQLADTVLKQALKHTSGNAQRAITLSEKVISENIAALGRGPAGQRSGNSGNNNGGGQGFNWAKAARGQ